MTYFATGLASPEEPLLDGNVGSNRESAWGNGQKQVCISAIGPARRRGPCLHSHMPNNTFWMVLTLAQAEKHVGRRHAKGRKGSALKEVKSNFTDDHGNGGSSGVPAHFMGSLSVDLYNTPAHSSKNAEGKVQVDKLGCRQLSGHEWDATRLAGNLSLSARDTAAKCRGGGTLEERGHEEGGTGAERPRFAATTPDDGDATKNDEALAAALAGYDVYSQRKKRGHHEDGNGGLARQASVHPPDRDGASSSKRLRGAGAPRGQAASADTTGGVARQSAQRVVMFTGFKGQELVELQFAVRSLGGECVPNFRAGVTHVVCACDAQRHAQRTLKYSLALISGAALVTPDWLRACRLTRAWREPWEDVHSVNGCVVHGIVHPGLRQRAIHPGPVFRGKCFYLAGTFAKPNPTKEELALLLKTGGATVVQHQPNLRSIIAVCGDDIEEPSYQHLRAIQATMVSAAFVMDSISLHCLQSEDGYAPDA